MQMAVGGIGYTQTYYYNVKTNQITSRDEEGALIAECLNTGDREKEQQLRNGEREQMKLLETFFMMQGQAGSKWNQFSQVEGKEGIYELTYVKKNDLEASICVGGEEVFQQMAALCIPGTMEGKWDFEFPQKESYDRIKNSAVIAPGDSFVLKNGYRINVTETGAYVSGYSYGLGSGGDDAYAEQMADTLTEFIKTANRGCFGLTVSAMNEETVGDLMDVIGQTGIDLRKEFTINGTRFREDNNTLSIVGAFAEDSKVWNRETEWRKQALKDLLYNDMGITEEMLETEKAAFPAAGEKGEKWAPYSSLANGGNTIEYNGVVFTLDYDKHWLCLGNMGNMDEVIRIPLSEGGCLMVNRDNIGELGHAIGMFSPEDVNRILRALKLDAKIQQMKKEIEEMEDGIGKSSEEQNAQSDEEAREIAQEKGKNGGFNGYGNHMDEGLFRLEDWQLEILTRDFGEQFMSLNVPKVKDYAENGGKRDE